ncbi:cation:proton antiporter [bacterium]|nr:cation:proton antiporter [bacterium]
MHFPILGDIVIIVALSVAVLYVFHRLKIPPIIGFLMTGVIAGPHGFGAVNAVEQVEVLAEVGVILLMFTIGLEISIRDLMRMKKSVLGGGGLQVGLSIAGTLGVFALLGLPIEAGVFAGFLVALSSTAIVLKQLQNAAQMESPHGRATLGILIFQDIIIVPMMLFTPLLAGAAEGSAGMEILILLAKSAGAVLVVLIAQRYLIPRALHQVAATRDKELFLLAVVALCFLVAWLTASIGLSLALGAFLAGMIVADSEYSHHAMGNVMPFRDLFTSFFFVSIGMLLDPLAIIEQPVAVLLLTVAMLVGKSLIATGAMLLLRFPRRTAVLTGVGLGQIGEFSFILSRVGVEYGLLAGAEYQLFLAVSVLTMAATPVMMAIAPRLADMAGASAKDGEGERRDPEAGLLIIGYGLNGRNLFTAVKDMDIPVSILEMNPDTVRNERMAGVPIGFGDATQDAVLLHAGAATAKVVVIAISDPAATGRITERVRALNSSAHIIARTRFISEVLKLAVLGADEVIPEEFETAIEIFARTLEAIGIDEEQIRDQVRQLRSDGYAAFRQQAGEV